MPAPIAAVARTASEFLLASFPPGHHSTAVLRLGIGQDLEAGIIVLGDANADGLAAKEGSYALAYANAEGTIKGISRKKQRC